MSRISFSSQILICCALHLPPIPTGAWSLRSCPFKLLSCRSTLTDACQPFEHGSIESVGDFEPKFKMQVKSGIDYFKIDSDGKYGRPHVQVIFSDDEGRAILGTADGVTELTEDIQGMLNGAVSEGAIPFKYSGVSCNLFP